MKFTQFDLKFCSPLVATICLALPLPALAVSFSERAGSVQADYRDQVGSFCAEQPHITITRDGRRFEQVLQSEGFCRMQREGFRIQDLDGDGEPEVALDFSSGGAHCCLSSQIFGYDPATGQYKMTEQYWGDGETRPLSDLNQDGVPEFLSYDTRFAYAFASFAASGFPIQIWQYRQGEMLDVTRQFPELIDRDAERYWQIYQDVKTQQGEVKGVLAAYLANKSLLNQSAEGWQQLRDTYQQPDRLAFFAQLKQFLEENGY